MKKQIKKFVLDVLVLFAELVISPFRLIRQFIIGDIAPQRWMHKTTGGIYYIMRDGVFLEKDLTLCVVYQSLDDGKIWVRPCSEFHDGRFERI